MKGRNLKAVLEGSFFGGGLKTDLDRKSLADIHFHKKARADWTEVYAAVGGLIQSGPGPTRHFLVVPEEEVLR